MIALHDRQGNESRQEERLSAEILKAFRWNGTQWLGSIDQGISDMAPHAVESDTA